MPDAAPLRFIVVCEADADRRTACGLADRVILEHVSEIRESVLDRLRAWVGLTDGSSAIFWESIPKEFKNAGLRVHGHFDGKPGAPDAHAARRALTLVTRRIPETAAVLLVRDSDGDLRRIKGLNQARAAGKCPSRVVIGVAHPNRECWLIAAYQPENKKDEKNLKRLVSDLKFNPCDESHCLTGKKVSDNRSSKRVLGKLSAGDAIRAEQWIKITDFAVLANRGESNGLAAFIDEIKQNLLPLFPQFEARGN